MSTRLIFLSRQISLGTADLPIPGLPPKEKSVISNRKVTRLHLSQYTAFPLGKPRNRQIGGTEGNLPGKKNQSGGHPDVSARPN